MYLQKNKIKIYILKIISCLINKSLSLKKKNFIFLLKLDQFIYTDTKLNIVLKKEIRDDDCIYLELYKTNQYRKIINLYFSNHILKNVTSMKRAKKCLDYWIPLIIKLSKKINKKIYLNLNCGDGEKSNFLSMNSNQNKNLIPDLYSFDASKKINKKLAFSSFEQFSKTWLDKQDKIYWRGSTTGNSYKSLEELNSLKRIEICKKFRDKKGMDIKISRIIQNNINKSKIKEYLIKERIFAKEVSENKFINYKYYPDIPGNSLAWGTITKYLTGSLIFKPDNDQKLYYYKLLKPWSHYIPVNNDFSDLEEKFIWSQDNITQSIEIAYSGYIIILEYLENIDHHFINASLEFLENNELYAK